MTDSLIGRELAGYRIEALLGEGGMGVVYRATNPVLGRTAAIKLLGKRHAQDAEIRERFMREPRSAAAINHPNIIAVYHAGIEDEQPFLIMQYVEGRDLRTVIAEAGALSVSRALAILEQIAGALDAAHARDLVHRDVKPENVLVETATDHAFLTDFGLARHLLAISTTEAGLFLGTPMYAAPEQIVGGAPCAAVDQYALGCVLFECLSREPPFLGRTREQIMHRHLQDPPPLLSERRADLPRALDDVIATALAKDPGDRYPSCRALLEAARSAVPRQSRPGTPQPLATSRPRRAATTVRRRSVAAVSPSAGGTAVGIGATVFALAAAAIAVGAGGFETGRLGVKIQPAARPAPLVGSAGSTALELRLPEGWQRLAPPTIPGITMAEAVAATPDYGASVSVVAGMVDAEGPRLLPGKDLELAGALPKPDAVALGLLQAWRYRGVRVRELSGLLTVYAVPTDRGAATVACLAATPAVATASAADCDRIAASMRLLTVKPYPLGPSATFASRVDRVLRRLSTIRRSAGSDLRDARTTRGQSRSARRLRYAYAAAEQMLASRPVGPWDVTARRDLVASLHRAATAFLRLADAARRKRPRTFRLARANVVEAVRRVDGAIARLGRARYRVS